MKSKNSKYFIPVIIISLIVGGLAGGITGFIASSFYSGSFSQWLSNPLGIGNLINPSDNQNDNQEINVNQNIQTPPTTVKEELSTTSAVQKVTPVVVSIVVTKELQSYYNYTGPNFPFDDFFGFNLDDFFSTRQVPGPKEKREVGGGTGFIISADGLIITNKHVVVDEEAEYSVISNDGTRYVAEVIAKDPFNDVAFIKINAKDLPTVNLGDSDKLQIGQTVIAIGYSLGEYSNTVTKGIISGIGRDIVAGGGGRTEKLEGVIQTDAAINPGNSGGPLINLHGEVIGINTAVNQQGQLIGFAIPINNAKPVIKTIKEKGKIVRPYIGIRYIQITEQLAKENNIAYDYGVLIIRGQNQGELAIMPGSPADRAGLEENDIILEINGIKLDQDHSLAKEIAKHEPGNVISLKIVHDGAEKTVQVELSEFPS